MEFDDIVTDEIGTWTELCEKHKQQAEKEGLGTASENAADMICGCKGCDKIADYYFDFKKQENESY
jgi:hypothetical protein